MKKYFLTFLTIIALSAVALSSFSGTMADEDAPEYDYPLYAGQNQLVGYVDVDNDGDNLYVNYIITEDGWCLSETHLDIQTDKDDFPYASSGRGRSAIQNVVPGLFAYSEPHECVGTKEYVILNEWDAETDLLVAAHANVEQWNIYEECVDVQVGLQAQSLEVVSDTTDLFFDEVNNEWKNAVAAWVHPAWNSNVNITGATWIWTDYKVSQDEAQFGAEPVFEKEFELPANAEDITGSIDITADNEYELFINDIYVGANNSWQTVSTYDVSVLLVQGSNTIRIEAVNWAWNTTNPEANPGGVIYKLTIEYDEPIYEEQCEEMTEKLGEESAWGAEGEAGTERFTQRGNWATYFVYVTQAHEPACNIEGNWTMDLFIGSTSFDRFLIIENYNELGQIDGLLGIGHDPTGTVTGVITGTFDGANIYIHYDRTGYSTDGYTAEFNGIVTECNEMSGTWTDRDRGGVSQTWDAFRI